MSLLPQMHHLPQQRHHHLYRLTFAHLFYVQADFRYRRTSSLRPLPGSIQGVRAASPPTETQHAIRQAVVKQPAIEVIKHLLVGRNCACVGFMCQFFKVFYETLK